MNGERSCSISRGIFSTELSKDENMAFPQCRCYWRCHVKWKKSEGEITKLFHLYVFYIEIECIVVVNGYWYIDGGNAVI